MNDLLITGGSGFIGRRLTERLHANTSRIFHDNIVRGHSYNSENLFFLSTYGNMAYHHDHLEMLRANVDNVISILNGFRGWFCYMSSSSVNLHVQTPYSRTKRAAEEILRALPELKSCIVRPYSVTGVGEQKEHLIPTLIRSCMEGDPMDFDASPVHDFVDIEDVVDGLVKLADKEFTGIIEFGNGRPVTNQEVKEIVEKTCGKKANIQSHRRMRAYDSSAWYCRERHPLWKPKKTLEQSVQEMVEAYERSRKENH